MSVKYADDWGLYSLNGVSVPSWLVEMPAEKITAKQILEEQNVEVKHEAVIKLGNDVFFNRLMNEGNGKILDKEKYYLRDKDNKVFLSNDENGLREQWYYLIEADMGFEEKFKIFKMENPSLQGIYHYELVTPGCNTVEDALEVRNGVRGMPEYIS
jgi:hypothetical protein